MVVLPVVVEVTDPFVLVVVARVYRALRHTHLDRDFLHRGLLETSFQEDIESYVQQLLVTLLLLFAGRSAHTRPGDLQLCLITNSLHSCLKCS